MTLSAQYQTSSQQAQQNAAGDAEAIVSQLDDETVRALGLLHKAPRGVPELAIATFDYGSRSLLEAYGLIKTEHRGDGTLDVTITPLGREVIKLCARKMPTLASSDLAGAVDRASELLSLASTSSVRAVPA